MANTQQPVTVSLSDLETGSVQLSTLTSAFGPSSLGIMIVKDLPPNFQPLRLKLLTYASQLAQLPEEVLDQLTNAASHYNVGWSHGKEALKPGQYDTMKGSYYATVISSHAEAELHDAVPNYEFPNIWPESHLPGFQETFEELCTLIIDIALLVAQACDRYATENVPNYASGLLGRIVRESLSSRARLLHYFPSSAPQLPISANTLEDEKYPGGNFDDWCALHVDDGCLTGLTSALFVDSNSLDFKPVDSPDPLAGLYIHSRSSETVKINIPADCLAFQTGSALEIMTGGKLKAVPHFVRGSTAKSGRDNGGIVARNTLAVFMQPGMEEVLDERTGITFGEHIRLSDEKHA